MKSYKKCSVKRSLICLVPLVFLVLVLFGGKVMASSSNIKAPQIRWGVGGMPCWGQSYQCLKSMTFSDCDGAAQGYLDFLQSRVGPGDPTTYTLVSSCDANNQFTYLAGSKTWGQIASTRLICPPGYTFTPDNQCQIAFTVPENLGKPISCPAGNPINQATGNKYQVETDYRSTSSSNSLTFTRYYNSQNLNPGMLGSHWRSNFDRSLTIVSDVTQDVLHVHSRTGRGYISARVGGSWDFTLDTPYTKRTGGDWFLKPDATYRFAKTASGWQQILSDDTVEDYDETGKLISITQKNGYTQSLNYNASNQLASVVDSFGRTLNFTYNTNGLLDKVTAPGNQVFQYAYDALNNLSSVTYPDQTIRQYVYEDTNFPSALTGIIDENNNRFATWVYDSQGRAISSEHAGSAERVTLVYNADGTTSVTDTLGAQQTYHFETNWGVKQVTQIDGGPCNSCGGQFSQTSYDANGFINSRTDFNGNTTTFINDTRGLQISRTEAAVTPVARTITTQWHPTFRLPLKITEPGKVTDFTYDANGRLLARQEQATP